MGKGPTADFRDAGQRQLGSRVPEETGKRCFLIFDFELKITPGVLGKAIYYYTTTLPLYLHYDYTTIRTILDLETLSSVSSFFLPDPCPFVQALHMYAATAPIDRTHVYTQRYL